MSESARRRDGERVRGQWKEKEEERERVSGNATNYREDFQMALDASRTDVISMIADQRSAEKRIGLTFAPSELFRLASLL